MHAAQVTEALQDARTWIELKKGVCIGCDDCGEDDINQDGFQVVILFTMIECVGE